MPDATEIAEYLLEFFKLSLGVTSLLSLGFFIIVVSRTCLMRAKQADEENRRNSALIPCAEERGVWDRYSDLERFYLQVRGRYFIPKGLPEPERVSSFEEALRYGDTAIKRSRRRTYFSRVLATASVVAFPFVFTSLSPMLFDLGPATDGLITIEYMRYLLCVFILLLIAALYFVAEKLGEKSADLDYLANSYYAKAREFCPAYLPTS